MVMTYFHKQRPCRLPTCSRKRDACRRRFKKKEKETAGRQAPIDIIHGLCPENEPAEKPEPGGTDRKDDLLLDKLSHFRRCSVVNYQDIITRCNA